MTPSTLLDRAHCGHIKNMSRISFRPGIRAFFVALICLFVFVSVLRTRAGRRQVPEYVLPGSYAILFGGEKGMDAIPFLASLAIHHADAHVYISTDTNTYEWYLDHARALSRRLNLHWTLALDRYNMSMGREAMTAAGMYKEFLMEKAAIMEIALTHHNDTILLDADFVLLEPVYIPAGRGYQLGVSPHFIPATEATKYGVYNAGMLWSNQYSIGKAWRATTKTSRYFEQAAIEDLIKEYRYFEFGPEHNLGYWRAVHDVDAGRFYKGLKLDLHTQKVTLNNQRVASVHSHILTKYPWKVANDFSDTILGLMSQSSDMVYHQLLDVIYWAKGGYVPSQLTL